jgi:hypothetical protein
MFHRFRGAGWSGNNYHDIGTIITTHLPCWRNHNDLREASTMKARLLATIFLAAGWRQFASAGLATFSPASQDVTPGTIAMMDLTLTPVQNADFDAADVIINSDAPISWGYSPGICGRSPEGCSAEPLGLGIKPYDLLVGGSSGAAAFGAPILWGTLSFETSNLAPGTYEVLIDSALDHLSNLTRSGVSEGLQGHATFTVVPEPTGALILSLGAIAAVCKRRLQ